MEEHSSIYGNTSGIPPAPTKLETSKISYTKILIFNIKSRSNLSLPPRHINKARLEYQSTWDPTIRSTLHRTPRTYGTPSHFFPSLSLFPNLRSVRIYLVVCGTPFPPFLVAVLRRLEEVKGLERVW